MANEKRPLRPLNPIIGCNRKRSPGMIQLSPLIKFTIPSLCPSSSSWSTIDTHSSAKLNPLQFFSLIKSWYQFNGIPELFLRLFLCHFSVHYFIIIIIVSTIIACHKGQTSLSSELSTCTNPGWWIEIFITTCSMSGWLECNGSPFTV